MTTIPAPGRSRYGISHINHCVSMIYVCMQSYIYIFNKIYMSLSKYYMLLI